LNKIFDTVDKTCEIFLKFSKEVVLIIRCINTKYISGNIWIAIYTGYHELNRGAKIGQVY
jgi:hypothetical protein